MVPGRARVLARSRVAIPLIVAIAAGRPAAAQAGSDVGVGTLAPIVTVNDLDGRPVNLGDYIGHEPVLILFWATWCDQCRALLPTARAAGARYGDRVKFFGINVTVGDSPAKVRQYLDEHDPPYAVLYDTEGVSQRAYGVLATAYVVVVDRGGRIVYTGYGPGQRLDDALARATGGQ